VAANPNTHSVLLGYIAWLFGFIGLHRFYYGKTLTGILWFFTLGLLFIGWIIDLFLIPSMDREAQRRFTPGLTDYSIAWLLLMFLGLLGIHRFYLGKWVTGIIYLISGGLLGIGWLYDLCTLNQQISDLNMKGRYA
jgi:TM2 domain-containing membrane protein YozV